MFNHRTQKNRTTAQPSKSRWLVSGIIGFVLLLITWLAWNYLPGTLNVISHQETVVAYLHGYGRWGAVLLVFLLSVQVITVVIPGQILLITSGYLYGFGGGLALNLLGSVVASQIAFVMARWAGRPLIERLIPAKTLNKWQHISSRQGLTFFLLFFWFPVIPGNIMNFVAGISSISFWSFFVANFFGRLPGLILITLIGAYGLELSLQQWSVLAAVALVLLVGGRYGATKLQQRYLV